MNHKEIFEEIFRKFEMDKLYPPIILSGMDTPNCFPVYYSRILKSIDPTTEEALAYLLTDDLEYYEKIVKKAEQAFLKWRLTPTPKRGELIRDLGEELRKHKKELGLLVSLEMGKIISEGEGEAQEMIDACDYAVGLSRMLPGLVLPSERKNHLMLEQWHPLGVIGIITAFNFPVAVWAWNAVIAAVCGNTMIWKPSSSTPLTAIAVHQLCLKVEKKHNIDGLFNLVIGSGSDIGEKMINDSKIKLISATGSCEMGKKVKAAQAKILGNKPPILELGGNNALIIMDDVKKDEALMKIMYKAILFGAIGTAGQRCTTIRRLLIHENIFDEVVSNLAALYKQIKIGDPLDKENLMGPLVSEKAVDDMIKAIEIIKRQGGTIICGGKKIEGKGFFVEPTIVVATKNMPIVKEETFAPILYCIKIKSLEEGIAINNDVPQGLSSSVFTNNLRNAFEFLSSKGSDCGIANVNMGTSGAEIGGAFGGEKETGGGREMGSDSWKQYMRRQTVAINYGCDLELAQGINFDVKSEKREKKGKKNG